MKQINRTEAYERGNIEAKIAVNWARFTTRFRVASQVINSETLYEAYEAGYAQGFKRAVALLIEDGYCLETKGGGAL